jgi:hypothetical protein
MAKKKDPAKLTLRLEREVIEAAKALAAYEGISLSDMVENYFRNVAIRPYLRIQEEKARYGTAPHQDPTVELDEPQWWQHVHPRMRAILRSIRRGENPERALAAVSPEEEELWLEGLSPNVRALMGIARPEPGAREVTKEDYRRYLEEKYR